MEVGLHTNNFLRNATPSIPKFKGCEVWLLMTMQLGDHKHFLRLSWRGISKCKDSALSHTRYSSAVNGCPLAKNRVIEHVAMGRELW